MKKLALVLAASVFSLSAHATELNYNFVEAGYIQTSIDELNNIDPKGFTLSGSK